MADTDEEAATQAAVAPAQPGQVISPGGAQQPVLPAQQPTAIAEPEAPLQVPQPVAPTPEIQTNQPLPDNTNSQISETNDSLSWVATEFVAHDKSPSWYMGLLLATLVVAAVVYLLTRDKISTGVVLVVALVFGMYASKKPHQLEYSVDKAGVSVGQKYHVYEEFRSFAIVPEGAFSSIVFMPLKRFATMTTIYYAPQDEDKIIDLLEDRLPLEEHGLDAVDRLMRRIRF